MLYADTQDITRHTVDGPSYPAESRSFEVGFQPFPCFVQFVPGVKLGQNMHWMLGVVGFELRHVNEVGRYPLNQTHLLGRKMNFLHLSELLRLRAPMILQD
jgi:hypothetical protein